MNRKKFLATLGVAPSMLTWISMILARSFPPEMLHFTDDGKIPNSKFPLLLYHDTLPKGHAQPDRWYLKQFADNNWTNAWTNGIYGFHHYHSTSHEVLGIFSGSAVLHLGGEKGKKVEVVKGDIVVIPAGVGHKNIKSNDLGVVGAYPGGRDWDLLRGEKGERPKADENIRALPIPRTDPFLGKKNGLTDVWR